jgi:hypothetical protein
MASLLASVPMSVPKGIIVCATCPSWRLDVDETVLHELAESLTWYQW